jgi:hypothetical protein
LTLICLLLFAVVRPAGAAVEVSRTGSENPMVEVARSVFWGGVAGLVIGSAIALARNGDDSWDDIRWGFVGGTFLGLGFGIYHVTTRPQPSAALDGRGLGLEGVVRPDGSGSGGAAPTSSADVRLTPETDFIPNIELDGLGANSSRPLDRGHASIGALPLRDPLTGAPISSLRTRF